MDFFYLIKGECSLEFEVKRTFDPNDVLLEETVKDLTPEEIESKKDVKSV